MFLKAGAVCSCYNKRLKLSRHAALVRISSLAFFFFQEGTWAVASTKRDVAPSWWTPADRTQAQTHFCPVLAFGIDSRWPEQQKVSHPAPHTHPRGPRHPISPPHFTVLMHSYENKPQTHNVLGHLWAICAITVLNLQFVSRHYAHEYQCNCRFKGPMYNMHLSSQLSLDSRLHDGLCNVTVYSFLWKWTQTKQPWRGSELLPVLDTY